MERKYVIILMILGIIAGIYGAITYQWFLMITAVALIVMVLIGLELAQWIKSCSKMVKSCQESKIVDMRNLEESLESTRLRVEMIEQRVSDLEGRDNNVR